MSHAAASPAERECPECTRRGFAPDNRWPATDEFWPRRHGRLHFGQCRACRYDIYTTTRRYFTRMVRRQTRKLQQARSA